MKIDIYEDKITPGIIDLLLEADPSLESIKSYLHDSTRFLAVESGEALGIGMLAVGEHAAEIKNISVDALFRRRGVGSALLAAMCEYCVQRGITKVLVATGNSSLGQLGFYQKLGFRITAVTRDYFDDYPEPIFENGIRCRDLLHLEMDISQAP